MVTIKEKVCRPKRSGTPFLFLKVEDVNKKIAYFDQIVEFECLDVRFVVLYSYICNIRLLVNVWLLGYC